MLPPACVGRVLPWLIFLTTIPRHGSQAQDGMAVTREVVPVPSVIAAVFRSCGLPAFDAFSLWERGRAKPCQQAPFRPWFRDLNCFPAALFMGGGNLQP
jgi:hypothetical protein